MKHIWSILSTHSIIDSERNTLSIIDCVEQFNIPEEYIKASEKKGDLINLPFISFEIISLWADDDIKKERAGEINIEIDSPKGKKLTGFDYNFIIPVSKKRIRTRIRVNGFVFQGEGDYDLKVKFREKKSDNYKLVAEIPIEVLVHRDNIKK